jgi:hypothetical protein
MNYEPASDPLPGAKMLMHAYLFEAKSIQSFILDSGKLRDLVGASELVDSLCAKPLADALAACGLAECALPEQGAFEEAAIGDRVAFSRRAGGAFYAFSRSPDSLARLAAFWPLIVQQYTPGLEFDQGQGAGADAFAAFKEAQQALRMDRSRLWPSLPQAGPQAHRSQRTGRAAVALRRTPDGDLEPLDAGVRRQRWASEQDEGGLVGKLAPPDSGLTAKDWPRNMDAREAEEAQEADRAGVFPFLGDNRYIAVVHADGNGLGQLLMNMERFVEEEARADYLSAFYQVSIAIEQATQRAAQRAVEATLLNNRHPQTGMLPARPVVLGGDDLTIIVRGDLAVPFTRIFLAAFEEETAARMTPLLARGLPVPERLTACAGIAYIKASQPFYLAAHLAEGITAAVKRQAKAIDASTPPSSLAWHRVTTAMIDEYGQALKQELTIGPAGERFRNSLGAYAVGFRTESETMAGNLPSLDDLLALQRLFELPAMARGPARQLLTLIGQSPEQARSQYKRWSALMRERANRKEDIMKVYEQGMARLIGPVTGSLPYREAHPTESDGGRVHQIGPLGDLHALMAVKNRAELVMTGGDQA